MLGKSSKNFRKKFGKSGKYFRNLGKKNNGAIYKFLKSIFKNIKNFKKLKQFFKENFKTFLEHSKKNERNFK